MIADESDPARVAILNLIAAKAERRHNKGYAFAYRSKRRERALRTEYYGHAGEVTRLFRNIRDIAFVLVHQHA